MILRGVKIVGNGSGAVCAAAILAMESGVPGYPPPAACVVRKRARAMQKGIDQKIDTIRLSQILRVLLEEHLPSSDHLSLGHRPHRRGYENVAVPTATLSCIPHSFRNIAVGKTLRKSSWRRQPRRRASRPGSPFVR